MNPLLKPLFIPLKKEYYEAFDRGEKTTEYRLYGLRWNGVTCKLGRSVVLSCGYGKSRRIKGIINSFSIEYITFKIPGWIECYGAEKGPAACIGITILSNLNAMRRGNHQT